MPISRRALVLIAVPLSAARKKELEWQKGRLAVVRHLLDNAGASVPMAEPTTQVSVSRFEIVGSSATYLVEETVARIRRLDFDGHLEISFAVDGKKVILRLPNGKERSMKLLETYIVERKPQNSEAR